MLNVVGLLLLVEHIRRFANWQLSSLFLELHAAHENVIFSLRFVSVFLSFVVSEI